MARCIASRAESCRLPKTICLARSTVIARPDAIQPAFDALLGIVDQVLAIDRAVVERAKQMDSLMSPSSVESHKIWIEQCAATEDIREQFGTKNALDYLIGEKLFSFVEAAERDSDFSAELPAFVAAIQRLFPTEEIRAYLDHLERTKFLAPPEPEIESNDDEEEEVDEEPWPAHPLLGAQELLRFSRIRQLLQPRQRGKHD